MQAWCWRPCSCWRSSPSIVRNHSSSLRFFNCLSVRSFFLLPFFACVYQINFRNCFFFLLCSVDMRTHSPTPLTSCRLLHTSAVKADVWRSACALTHTTYLCSRSLLVLSLSPFSSSFFVVYLFYSFAYTATAKAALDGVGLGAKLVPLKDHDNIKRDGSQVRRLIPSLIITTIIFNLSIICCNYVFNFI